MKDDSLYKLYDKHCKLNALCFILYAILIITVGCSTTNNSELLTSNSEIFWPPLPQTPRIQFLKSIYGPTDIGIKKSWFKRSFDYIFGREGLEDMILRPYGIYVDSSRIYVTDPGINLVHVFDTNDRRYFSISKMKDAWLISPIGVATDKNGDIYITDSVLKKVFVFDKNGKYLRAIGSSELFMRPSGIAIDEYRIYIVDTLGNDLKVLDKQSGKELFRFGKNGFRNGEFNYPTNIFIGKDKIIHVTDTMNFRIQIFDRDGNFISAFGKHGDSSGDLSKPKGVAVDSEGHIYVADAHFDNVQIFDRDGKLLLAFGNTGRLQGQLFLPAGIFIDEQDRIYVADSYNNRIQVFQYLKEIK